MKSSLLNRIENIKSKKHDIETAEDAMQSVLKSNIGKSGRKDATDADAQNGVPKKSNTTASKTNNTNTSKAHGFSLRDSETKLMEREWRNTVYELMLAEVDLAVLGHMPDEQARKQARQLAFEIIEREHIPLNQNSRTKIVKQIEDELIGLGPLEDLLVDPTISDILINGANQIYVERRGVLEKVETTFNDNKHLMKIIDKIVTSVGRRIDESSPMVDARLADGSRVNVIIPPLSLDGPMMSIRRFEVDRLTAKNLITFGSITKDIADVLQAAVKLRLNILISGGTGSGKTTMLNILSAFIPENERIVTIEDSAELQLQQDHVVRLETRPANIEGSGEYTQRELVKNSLRMRPDRVIIGEVRGAEALDMLQAMNTGHDGSLATLHANSPRDALSRIENMIAMGGIAFPDKAIREQIASAVDLVIQISRLEDGSRRMTSLQEVTGMEGNSITTQEIFTFQRDHTDSNGKIVGEHVATGVIPTFFPKLKRHNIDLDSSIFDPATPLQQA